ncbi:MAG: aldo/keto reductase [Methanobacteriaceae archaeon]|jgi:hypothetical protein|nr:aldo/keto reductase [Methanobacteriaceae archaeon]
MKYRKLKKTGDNLSLLGYGCMRFPRKNGRIDLKKTEQQVIKAIENGINYFDTAYTYSGSEETLGKILKNGYREKIKIATKIPIPSIKTKEDINRIFEKQLKRLQTNYIDYYLIHNVYTYDEWEKLKRLGFLEFIDKEKKKGRILNIGFSFHGNIINFKKIIDSYDWDLCMIQYNYLDENYQAGSEGLNYASSKDIGVIVMEPLRGGILVNKLSDKAKEIIDNFKIKKTPAEWGFKWVADNPNVKVVLSGMGEDKIIDENIKFFSKFESNTMNDDEKKMLESVKDIFQKSLQVNCTSCGYCLPCPQNVDIPNCFSSYNDKKIFKNFSSTAFYLYNSLNNNSGADKCIKCGICEKKCPQKIAIIKELENVDKEMNKWYMRYLAKIVLKFMYRN